MAVILYGVAGEGFGHATRSKALLDDLTQHHEVHILAGGKANTYLSKHFKNIHHCPSLRLAYLNNSIVNIETAFINVKKLPGIIGSLWRTFWLIKRIRPDLIITDFHFQSAWLGWLSRSPVLSIDNEHAVVKTLASYSSIDWWSRFRTLVVCKLIVPSAKAYCITSFFFPPVKGKRTVLCGPILRKKIISLKPTKGSHILVYQTSRTNKKLLQALLQVPDEKFVIYGFEKEKKEGNCTFKKFNEDAFFSDLASCKALISNGGYSLLSEALYLKKPVLSIPINKMFEQTLNAYQVQYLQFGWMAREASKSTIIGFLAFADNGLFKTPDLKPGNTICLNEINRILNSNGTVSHSKPL